MSESVAWFIALRYLKPRRLKFAAFITWVSVAGLTLGVLVLTAVVSVMNGFDRELKTRILGTVPHVLLPGLSRSDPRVADILSFPEVVGGYDFFLGAGMLTRGGAVNPVSIYGIDPEDPAALDGFRPGMVDGSLGDLAGPGREIVLGEPLAMRLGLLPGDTVALIVSEPTKTGLRPIIQPYRLTGTFEMGSELDYALVVMAQEDFPVGDLATAGRAGFRLTLSDPLLVNEVADRLQKRFPGLPVESWMDSYGELFDAVRMEKLLMFIILLMVVAVAAFSIVSGQMMVVTDKRADIAILLTMGAQRRTVMQTFLLQGVLISGTGIGVGLGLGVLVARSITHIVAWLKGAFGFGLLDFTFFTEVPVLIRPGDLVLIALLSGILCLLSAWIPARKAASLNPVEGLHY